MTTADGGMDHACDDADVEKDDDDAWRCDADDA